MTATDGDAEQSSTSTHSLGESVRAFLVAEGFREIDALARVRSVWPDVVGVDAVPHCRPRTLHDGELLVGVDHPSWATEMTLAANTVLSRLAERLGSGLVCGLKVHVEARFGVE